MPAEQLPINTELLRWAREESGLSLDEAASRAKITPLKREGMSPSQRLEAWEEGKLSITLRQLESIAKAYRRPALTFFLSAPPVEQRIFTDFRTVASKEKGQDTPEYSAFILKIQILHDELAHITEQTGGEGVNYVGALSIKSTIEKNVTNMRTFLNFSFDDQQGLNSKNDLLRALRIQMQNIGIYVIYAGDLGSYHSQIDPNEFRGLSISHPKAPMVVVNSYDTKAAMLFSLIHEFVHIGLGYSSISNTNAFNASRKGPDIDVEKFCNATAAEFLVPTDVFLRHLENENIEDISITLSNLSRRFKVSRMVIAKRMFDLEKLSEDDYRITFLSLKKEWERYKDKQRSADGGPTRNTLDAYRLGEKTINTLFRGISEGLTSIVDVSRITGIKTNRFKELVK